MNAIMNWIVRHPVLSFGLALLITFAFAGGLRDLQFDTSNRGLMAEDDPAVDLYEEVVATFGEDSILTLVLKSEDVFQEDILRSIERLTLAGGAIEGVSRAVSLTTVSNLKGEEGLLITDDLLAVIPSDPEELAKIRADALSNELLLGEVVSRDGRTAAVHLFLQSLASSEEFEAQVIAHVEELLDAERAVLGDDVEMYQVGTPFLRQEVRATIRHDLVTLSPISLGILFLTLFVFFRTLVAGLPAVTGLMSVIATLGFMGHFGYGITTVSSMLPILLLVVGSAEDIHLLAEYGTGLRNEENKGKAVESMAMKSRIAILLTSVTTLIGFLTMAWNPLPALAQFGVSAAFGIGINFLLTILVVPSLLQFVPAPKALKRPEKESMAGLRRLVLSSLTHRRQVVTIAVVATVVAIIGASLVEVDTDYLRFFPEDALIQRLNRDVSENLVGAMPLLVVVDTHRPEGVKDPRVLQELVELTDFLRGRWDKVIGYTDYLRKLHLEINAGDPAFDHVPLDPELISQYTLLLDPDDVSRFVDFDGQRTVIMIRGEARGSSLLRAELERIDEFVAANVPRDLDVQVTGEAMLVYRASDTISKDLLTSIGWVLVPIFICISLLFSSWKAGVLAMVPNVLPIVFNFGAMGFLGIPLSVATFPVSVIALGIAVDDTIHFMTRFAQEIKLTSNNREAIDRTLRHELQPVFVTSTALLIGFSVLCLGEFASTRQFGFLAALTMGVAWLTDLMVTPLLLETTPLITAWDLLRLKIGEQVVEKSPLFRGLKASEIKKVALLGTVNRYHAGDHLLTQGEEGDDMLVLLTGGARIEASDAASGRTRAIGGVAPGDVIGEVAFFTKSRRTASVIATEDGECLLIDAARMRRVAARFPKIASKVYANLAELMGGKVERATLQMFEAS